MHVRSSVVERALAWSRLDPNETTARYVDHLRSQSTTVTPPGGTIHAHDHAVALAELNKLFPETGERIAFGTAGLRSAMKPGPLGMNDLVVVQTAQGLARYCRAQAELTEEYVANNNNSRKLCAVVGYDHRANPSLQLSSLSFALLTALVFRHAGWECFLMDGFVATPLVPFALSQISNAVVGIMITASHNPKQDAGYKVYWNDGCQIRPPVDAGIAHAILQELQPWMDYRRELATQRATLTNDPCLGLSDAARTQGMIRAYLASIQASGLVTAQGALIVDNSVSWKRPPPKFCYTAMHGVGLAFVRQSFDAFGLPEFLSVPSQQEPDPAFPTVPFPNPEEAGALDLAKAFAEEQGCRIVLANDPDADRLAVAEQQDNGSWTVFTGDQIGVLLGHWLWSRLGPVSDKPIAMCASTVSSRMLAEIAAREGFYFEDTLTGFKWIGSRAAELHRSGSYRTIFCYEEAIGFCCGDLIFDKDGVTAAAVFAELALDSYRNGRTLAEHMQTLYDKYGEFVSNNGYFILDDPTVVPAIMDRITNHGAFETLDSVGTYAIDSIRYLGEPSYDSTTPDRKPTLPTSQSSPMLTIRLVNGCVAQFRASGTEPKFKYYIELKGAPGVDRKVVEAELRTVSSVLLQELLQPSKFGLKQP
jgi:phosphomannomutase